MYLPPDQFAKRIIAVPHWTESVTRGDILLLEHVSDDPNMPLPCLVLEVTPARSGKWLLVAPGQAGCAIRDGAFEIGVRAPSEWAPAGLAGPTRFLGAKRIVERSSSARISRPLLSGTPVVGKLTGAALDRMNAVRARIHAERDIAAHYALRRAEERAEDRRITAAISTHLRREDA